MIDDVVSVDMPDFVFEKFREAVEAGGVLKLVQYPDHLQDKDGFTSYMIVPDGSIVNVENTGE